MMTLAYKYVAIVAMLVEINHYAEKLHLPIPLPITESQLRLRHVSNPKLVGFGGTIETERYSFVFFQSGILRRIIRLKKTDQRTIREIQIEQSRMRSLIGTNEALALARKWLTEMDVDIYRLEMEHMPRVEQAFFYPDSTSISDPPQKQQRKTLLPVFHIVWGTDTTPVIRISIFGPTQELLSLQQEDTTYSKRLRVIMKDPEGLLAIRDHDFLRLSEKEKAALVQSHIIESPPATHPQKP